MEEFGEPINGETDTKEDVAEFGESIQVEKKDEKLGEGKLGEEQTPPRRTGGMNWWRERAPAVRGRRGGGDLWGNEGYDGEGRPEVARARVAAAWAAPKEVVKESSEAEAWATPREVMGAEEAPWAGQGAPRSIARLSGRWMIPRHLWEWCKRGLGANLGGCEDRGAPDCR
jgi:hypothetical protein